MSHPKLSFQVRIEERATLVEMGDRVGASLQCRFVPSSDRFFERGEAMEATCLGLWITISHDPDIPEGELRNYCLMGMLRADLEDQWDIEAPRISISEYILNLLSVCDRGQWYIPDVRELYAEAGLSPPSGDPGEIDTPVDE